MSRTVHADVRDLVGALPAHDLAPERARAVLGLAVLALAEGTPAVGWRDRLGRWWGRALEPAFLTTLGAGWLAWVALQLAALAR